MIVERFKQLILYVVVGSLVLFLAVKIFQDPGGAAHVLSSIVFGIGKVFGAIWVFISTLWNDLNKK